MTQPYTYGMYDCLHASLGTLEPPALPGEVSDTVRSHIADGSTMINGVHLPQHVMDELRQLGIPLSWYTGSELEDAIAACAYDRQLIDDHAGLHFRDKLHLSKEEKLKTPGFHWQSLVEEHPYDVSNVAMHGDR